MMTKLLVFKKNGDFEPQQLSQDEFLSSLKEHNLPCRDLKLLLRSCDSGRVQHPAILPRPRSKCFIFLMEHIKMICLKESPQQHFGIASIADLGAV